MERAALAALPSGTLMQRAGHAAAAAASALLPDSGNAADILVLVGPGNNGGDALEASCLLAQTSAKITVLLFAESAAYTGDARQALARAKSSSAFFPSAPMAETIRAKNWALVIDGLFGIGLTRPIDGAAHDTIAMINQLQCPVLALDVPSGLDADTGAVTGGDRGIAVRATHTLTFIGDKPGLHTCDGRDFAGAVQVASLDIPESQLIPAHTWLNEPELFANSFSPRLHNSHKGSYGDVAILGGSAGMSGAAVLAARAAAYGGAGRVFIAFVEEALPYVSEAPELMCRSAAELDFFSMTIVAGPGMGNSAQAHDRLLDGLSSHVPLVIDADALNLLAKTPQLQQMLSERRHPAIITPHPLEAARLLSCASDDIQKDRMAAARALARRFNAITVLKGSGTVIARPDGDSAINTTGNPALATAGTGDVLAGLCGALLAQGHPAWEAALAAVWLHGCAADDLVADGIGPIGVTASELLPAIRTQLNLMIRHGAQRF